MQDNKMKMMWNQHAKKNAFYYVESAFWDGEVENFFLLGEERTKLIIEPIIDKFKIYCNNSAVLEIECGVGRFSRALSKDLEMFSPLMFQKK